MSYLVLARKWRPQTFSDLTGQEHVSQTLKNAIESGRVAHAFLFTGARGVGKTSSARIMAKALNCEQGMSPEPCNVCPACIEITAGTSVDVLEIDGASNTSVDDIRELRENIKYLPSSCRFKIIIIDEVHMLSTSAFNALLKTLEEPPPHVKFIFATTEPHKVPITILSRCQRFDFKRIPLHKVVARLRFIVDQEQVAISDEALSIVARKGDGSMRDSLSILDQVLAFCGESISDEEVINLLGVVDRRLLLDTSAAIFSRDNQAVLRVVKRVDEFGYNMRQFCQELIEHFRNLAILAAVDDASDLLDLAEGELASLRQQGAGVELSSLQRHLTILLKADLELANAAFPRLILEMTLLKMASLAPVVPVHEILDRLKQLQGAAQGVVADARVRWSGNAPTAREESQPRPAQGTAPAPRPASPEKSPAPAASPVVEETRPPSAVSGADWPGFVAFVRERRVRLGSMLEHGSPLAVSPERVEIGFSEGSFALSSLKDSESMAALRKLAGEYFGTEPEINLRQLSLDTRQAPPNLIEKKKLEEQERLTALRSAAESNATVSAALEIFGGELAGVAAVEKKESV